MHKLIVTIFSLTFLAALEAPVYAAQSDDGIVCAAIHPCALDGSVLPPFNTSDVCGLRYAKECLSVKANAALDECSEARAKLQDALSSQEKVNAKLKRKLRQLRRGQR